jgi:GT2 family glycosyltransferase
VNGPPGDLVSVVVVSYGTRDLLRSCLAATWAQEAEVQLEVFVVDNASTDGSADMVAREFPRTRLIRNAENRGFAVANNQALAQAAGRYLLLLNSDAEPLPGSIAALRDALRDQPGLGVAGPSLWNRDGSRQPSWGDRPRVWHELLFQSMLVKVWPCRFPYGRKVHPLQRAAYGRYQRVDWATGASLMFTRDVQDAIGGLPEDGFMYGEDLEFCLRAGDRGFGVAYVPQSRMLHLLQGSRRDYAAWIESYTRAILAYYERRATRSQRRRAALLIAAGSLMRMAACRVLWLLPSRARESRERYAGYARARAMARRDLALSARTAPS